MKSGSSMGRISLLGQTFGPFVVVVVVENRVFDVQTVLVVVVVASWRCRQLSRLKTTGCWWSGCELAGVTSSHVLDGQSVGCASVAGGAS